MKIKLDNKIPFKIIKNDYNKVSLPKGMFWNIPKIKHNNIWYNCNFEFENNTLIISNLFLENENSGAVKGNIIGEFHREKVSTLKKNLILYSYNSHVINYKIFNYKKQLIERKKTILVFIIAIVISSVYYILNSETNNCLMDWISKNLLAQTFILFLTLSGFINIFTPFTIQKEITKQDIREITSNQIDVKQKAEKQLEINKERASM